MTNSIVTLTKYVLSCVESNKEALGIKRATYGDIDNVMDSVIACVIPNIKTVELRTTGMGVEINFEIYVLIYFSYHADAAFNAERADLSVESLETILNADHTFNGNVTFGMVSQIATGYTRKSGELVRSSRLTISAKSYDRI